MKELRLLTIKFNTLVGRDEISAFRGALISKVGVEQEWFHNHNNDVNTAQQYHYRYPLEVKTLDIHREAIVQMKGTRLKAFSLDFETNFFLPNYIGLGKSVSCGFGVVKTVRSRKAVDTDSLTPIFQRAKNK